MKTLLFAYLLVLPILAEYVSEVEYTLENLGCWADTGSRAIPNVFYGDAVDTIAKCKAAAIENGWSVFAVQYSQECFSGPDAADTYTIYGASTACNDAGTGGSWAQQVYRVSSTEYTIINSDDVCIAPGDVDQSGYRGTLSTTVSGNTCQAWTAQSPNEHTRTADNYPHMGLGEHNHCRNPDGEVNGTWCYNSDSTEPRWEYCSVPQCQTTGVDPTDIVIENCWADSSKTKLKGDKMAVVYDLENAKIACLALGCSGLTCHKKDKKGCTLISGEAKSSSSGKWTAWTYGPC